MDDLTSHHISLSGSQWKGNAVPVEVIYRRNRTETTARFLHNGTYVSPERAAEIELEERQRAARAKTESARPLRSVAMTGGNTNRPHKNRTHAFRPVYEIR